jgi:hypothetical protein
VGGQWRGRLHGELGEMGHIGELGAPHAHETTMLPAPHICFHLINIGLDFAQHVLRLVPLAGAKNAGTVECVCPSLGRLTGYVRGSSSACPSWLL